ISDVMGLTGRRILQALIDGQQDPEQLASLAQGKVQAKREVLVRALRGHLKAHHRFLLKEILRMVDALDLSIKHLDLAVEEILRPLEATIQRLDEVTGLARRGIETLLAELGWNMEQFPDAAHAASWVGICPGDYQSGGKRLSGKIRKGNRWVKAVLVQG